MTDSTARKHYHDIDGARSVLMFLSVALHAGTVYAPARPWITANLDRHDFFDWVIFGLHLFITPTFFFVGGFFTVLLLSRRSVPGFFWNRFLRTAIPLISIAVTFNMIELYLRYRDAGGNAGLLEWPFTENFATIWTTEGWQLHLWFLVSLMPMFLLAGIIDYLLPKKSWPRSKAVALSKMVGKFAQSNAVFPFFVILLAMANTANYAAASLVPGAYELLFPGFQSWYKLVSEFPFFIIGVMAALAPNFLDALCKWRNWMPWAAAAAFFFQPYSFPHQGFELGFLMLFLNQLVMWVLVLFILQFFHRYFNQGGPRTAWLADCALSMYLFHHCLIYIYGRWLADISWPIGVEFVVLTAMAAGTVMIFHEYFIRRILFFRLLFNGKTDVVRPEKRKLSAAA